MAVFTLGGVEFRETGEWKSPVEAWGDVNSRLTVEYLVNWTDRRAARLALLGTTAVGSFQSPINFTGNTQNGTAVITGVSSFAGLAAGQSVTGPGIAAGSAIASVSTIAGKVTLTLAATATAAGVSLTATANYAYLRRQNPHRYPSGEPLYATVVTSIRPEGSFARPDANGVAQYTDARLTCVYEYLPWEIAEDSQVHGLGGQPDESLLLRNVVIIPTESARMLTYRGGVWRWLFTNNPATGRPFPVTSEVGTPLLTTDFEYIWMGVPATVVPKATILAAVGLVNATTWDDMEAGTFMVRPPAWERTRLPDGTRALNVHIRGVHNPRGWNYFPDPRRANQFFEIGQQATATGPVLARPYPGTDIAALFRPRSA